MKSPSHLRFVVIGSKDRQLEELLGESGAMVTSQSVDALVSLAHGTSAPDALVLDLREQQSIPEALAIAKRRHPQMVVVIVAAQLDPGLMLEAMRAGVTEWIAEPVSASALIDAIQRVMAQRSPKLELGQVFAFVGAKGGVGTTTVAVNVATVLGAAPPRSALLIDLHLMHGDAALFIGADPRFSTADVLDNIHRLDEAFLKGLVTPAKPGVHLLASADRPLTAPVETRAVRELIAFAAQRYAYVILDVPRSDMTMLDSLEMATSIIVVANQELATVRRAGALAMTLRQRYGKDRVGVVINRFDRSSDIGREDVERVTGGAVRCVIPSDYRLALEGLNSGQPVVMQNHNQLAGSLSSLARELAGLKPAKPPKKEERTAGLFGRLGMSRS